MVEEPFLQGAADISARLRDLEEGRRHGQEATGIAAAAIVDLKEDVHDVTVITQGLRDDLAVHRIALREDITALTVEVRKTNGSVQELRQWRLQHIAEHVTETDPVIVEARAAFPTLKAITEALAAQSAIDHDASIIRGFWKKLGRDTWQKLLAAFGMISLLGLLLDRWNISVKPPW